MAEVHEVLEVLEVASLVFGDATAARTWMTITLSHARDSRWVIMWWGGLGARMLARANGPDGKRERERERERARERDHGPKAHYSAPKSPLLTRFGLPTLTQPPY